MIGDPKVRGHYAEDLRARVARMFGRGAGAGAQQGRGGPARNNRPFGSGNFGGNRPWRGRQGFGPGNGYVPPVTPELRRSAIASGLAGGRAGRACWSSRCLTTRNSLRITPRNSPVSRSGPRRLTDYAMKS